MIINTLDIPCQNLYNKQVHKIVRYTLNKNDDIYKDALLNAPILASQMNPYSPSGKFRSIECRNAMTFAGYIAENIVMDAINRILNDLDFSKSISAHPVYFDRNTAIKGGSFSQVDIAVTNRLNNKSVSIEVRSSIVKKSIEYDTSVYNQDQSLVGSYSTENKAYEVIKDFYVTVLFRDTINRFKDNFGNPIPNWRIINSKQVNQYDIIADISGGASKNLLQSIGQHDDLDQNGADYRNIKPICKSNSIYDIVFEIYNLLK